MATGPVHSVSVGAAVVTDDGKVLAIQRRDNGHWEPPGGVLELHEGLIDGLRREVLEETGLEVEPVALSGVYKNLSKGIVALVFRCRVAGGSIHETSEAVSVAWLERAEIEDRMTEAFAVRITDALDFAGMAAVRTHDGQRLCAAPLTES